MKRRRSSDKIKNRRDHRDARQHAYTVLEPFVKSATRRTKTPIDQILNFHFTLETEDGDKIQFLASRTSGGFTLHFPHTLFTGESPQSRRAIGPRLELYRRHLNAWQHAENSPRLIFRHFALLMAALSYDPQSNPLTLTQGPTHENS